MPTLTRVQIRNISSAINMDHLEPLLESSLQRSMTVFPNFIARGRLRNFLFQQLARILSHEDAAALAAEAGGRLCGLACWTTLAWDSQMFGFPAARLDLLLTDEDASIEIKQSLLLETLEGVRKRGIRHIIARVDAGDLSTTRALEQAGFEIIDGIQTFSLLLTASTSVPRDLTEGIQTRLFEEQDLNQILDIARHSYIFDRFHADTAIDTATADRINEEWLLNSCNGKAADSVVVAIKGTTVLGYATCKIDREIREGLGLGFGSIVMVATEERARKRGVAMACTEAAIRWFQSRNVEVVQVGTQLRNIPAARLYEKCGFRLIENTLTLRKLL